MKVELFNGLGKQEAREELLKARDCLSAIPPEEWCTSFFSVESKKQCCAFGHLVRLSQANPDDYSWCSDDQRHPLRRVYVGGYGLADANNYPNGAFDQLTPKDRSLAFIDAALSGLEEVA